MPQPAPKPAAQPAGPPTGTPSPGSDAATPQPEEEGAIFLALLDAGADARVAYTAEKRLHTMISDAITPQFQSLTAEMTRRFDGIDRRLDGIDRRLNEHDRKLDVLTAQMRLLFGAMGLLITALIAVFGILFAR